MLYSDRVDLPEIGRWALDHWPPLLEVHAEQRDRWLARGKTVVDVSYSRLVADGMPVVEEIYQRAGIEVTSDARAAIATWQEQNPQHRHGRHRYDLGEFGLTRETVDDAFAPYAERFGGFW